MKIVEIDKRQDFLSQDPWTFDQTSQGWRSLPLNKQAEVLELYIRNHVQNGKFKNMPNSRIEPGILMWHLGQILAFQDKNDLAIKWMNSSKNSDSDWNNYVDATVTFIKKDKKTFDNINIVSNNNSQTLLKLKNNWNKFYKDVY